jgi:hypothetical protein
MMANAMMLDDVRDAKIWLDQQTNGFDGLAQHLRAIETAYLNRSGDFSAIPRQRPASVDQAIAAAANEPGRDLLNETRSSKAG